jgi:molybdenum cofactor guanylyltransferase
MRGAILAGGHASRFGGEPKGLEKVGGVRILDRVVAALADVTDGLPLLIANHPAAATWHEKLDVQPDLLQDRGSLGGIYTAIKAASEPVLVVAWDMPFLHSDLLRALIKPSKSYDVFLPASDGPLGVEPLCGVYGPTCIGAIRESIDDEDYRTTAFHEHVRVGTLPVDQIQQFGDPATLFFNVNSPSDLKRAEELQSESRAETG